MLPSAHAILWFMATFLGCWAVSLIVRGLAGERLRARRTCPSCGAAVPTGLRCDSCHYEAAAERDLRRSRPNLVMVAAGAVIIPIAIGVAMLGEAFHRAVTQTGELSTDFSGWDAPAGGALSFALVLLAWAVRGDRSRGRRRCPKCWYNMTGVGLQCPECGHHARHTSHLYRPRRYRAPALAAIILMLGAALLHTVPLYLQGGWVAAVPATVSIAAFPWTPDELVYPKRGGPDFTLSSRLSQKQLSAWQERWLTRRAARTLETTTHVQTVIKCLAVIGDQRPELRNMERVIARALVSPNLSDQSSAALCVDCMRYSFSTEKLESNIEDLIPSLVAALTSPATTANASAAIVSLLARCPHARARYANELVAAIKSVPVPYVSYYAETLGPAAASTPELREALAAAAAGSPSSAGCIQAVYALVSSGEIVSADIRRALWRTVSFGSDHDALLAAELLARDHADPAQDVAVLMRAAESKRSNRSEFLLYLTPYSRELSTHIPRIFALAGDPEPPTRVRAVSLLKFLLANGTIGEHDQRLDAAFSAAQNDTDPEVRSAGQQGAEALRAARGRQTPLPDPTNGPR